MVPRIGSTKNRPNDPVHQTFPNYGGKLTGESLRAENRIYARPVGGLCSRSVMAITPSFQVGFAGSSPVGCFYGRVTKRSKVRDRKSRVLICRAKTELRWFKSSPLPFSLEGWLSLAESTGLENRQPQKGLVGSNPTPSAF